MLHLGELKSVLQNIDGINGEMTSVASVSESKYRRAVGLVTSGSLDNIASYHDDYIMGAAGSSSSNSSSSRQSFSYDNKYPEVGYETTLDSTAYHGIPEEFMSAHMGNRDDVYSALMTRNTASYGHCVDSQGIYRL